MLHIPENQSLSITNLKVKNVLKQIFSLRLKNTTTIKEDYESIDWQEITPIRRNVGVLSNLLSWSLQLTNDTIPATYFSVDRSSTDRGFATIILNYTSGEERLQINLWGKDNRTRLLHALYKHYADIFVGELISLNNENVVGLQNVSLLNDFCFERPHNTPSIEDGEDNIKTVEDPAPQSVKTEYKPWELNRTIEPEENLINAINHLLEKFTEEERKHLTPVFIGRTIAGLYPDMIDKIHIDFGSSTVLNKIFFALDFKNHWIKEKETGNIDLENVSVFHHNRFEVVVAFKEGLYGEMLGHMGYNIRSFQPLANSRNDSRHNRYSRQDIRQVDREDSRRETNDGDRCGHCEECIRRRCSGRSIWNAEARRHNRQEDDRLDRPRRPRGLSERGIRDEEDYRDDRLDSRVSRR